MRMTLRSKQHFVVCVETGEYPVSLERSKIYKVIRDRDAERHQQIRVVDESGEDYLYPMAYFRPLKLSTVLKRLLFRAKRRNLVHA